MMSKTIELSEIIREMREVRIRMNISAKEIFELARQKAQAERIYKVALRMEILKLKTEKYPATLINDLARGEEGIAELRFQRDLATEKYKAGVESMKTTRTEASLLQTISKYQNEF
jgi:hypothetical protein